MAIDYIWEGPKAQPTVPYSPATGLDNANNIFYVSSRATKTNPGQWIPVGGGADDVTVFQTNGVDNTNQLKLNLNSSASIAISNDGAGNINFVAEPNSGLPDVFVVTAYGALGNGVNDDTAAIQSTIDAATEAGGGFVYFPIGQYMVSSTLVIQGSHITLVGVSSGTNGNATNGSRITAMSGSVSPIIQIGGASNAAWNSWTTLINLNIQGVYTATQIGLYCNYFGDVFLNHCQFNRCGQAESIDTGARIVHNDVGYTWCGSGDTAATAMVRVENQSTPSTWTTEQVFFEDCVFSGDQETQTKQGICLYLGPSTTQSSITGCKFDCTGSAYPDRMIVIDRSIYTNILNNFIACGSSGADTPTGSAVIALVGTDTSAAEVVNIVGNVMLGWTSTPCVLVGQYCAYVTIVGNTLNGSGLGTAVVVNAGAFTVQAMGNLYPAGDTEWSNGGSTSSSCIEAPSSNSTFVFTDNISVLGTTTANVQAASDAFSALVTDTATSSANFSGAYYVLSGSFWNGSAPALDSWSIKNIYGTGSNPLTILQFAHAGTPGPAYISFLENEGSTNAANFPPPIIHLDGTYWNGSASIQEEWSITPQLGSGSNPTSTLLIGHSGTSGASTVEINSPLKLDSSVGFYGTSPQTQPTITGSKGSNAALASLITALASLGLVIDSTS
jgi:hypothetical protein